MDWKVRSEQELTPGAAIEELRVQMGELRRQQEELSRRTAAFEGRYRKVRASLSAAVNRAARAESYLEPFLRSRIYRGVWGLGLAARPGWVDKYEQRRGKEQARVASVKARAEEAAAEAAEITRLSRQLDAEMAAIAGGRGSGQDAGGNGTSAAEAMAETEMDAALLHLVSKGFRPSVILDVGSAKGFWSERTRWLYYPEADYYMIDPLDESQGHLRELAQRSGKFHPLQMAIGREKGEMTMNVTPDGDGSSLLVFPNSAAAQRTVPVETLDGLLADGRIKTPELVKIDVQGFEIEVLAGASRLFGVADVFIIEVNMFPFVAGCPVAHEVVAYMAERGYRIYDLAGLLRRPFENDLGQMDLVFVRNESRLVSSNRWK
ncbi:MAG TPA: FkbM family methyltransferase [Tepidisphaeraceae bacterium]|jgi:FkbM family methyltransferase|nr:FkbM family methyltransferase [Tepidisphaeraceae bacterium]